MSTEFYLQTKKVLQDKLFDAIHELQTRASAKSSKASDIQRMFGVVLGIRIALMQLNIANSQDANSFAGANGIWQLIGDGFGQMSQKQVQDYAWPSF